MQRWGGLTSGTAGAHSSVNAAPGLKEAKSTAAKSKLQEHRTCCFPAQTDPQAVCLRCLHSIPALVPLEKQAFEHRHLCNIKIVMSMFSGPCVLGEGSKFQPKNREQLGCMAKTRLCLAFIVHSFGRVDCPYHQSTVSYKCPKQEKINSNQKNFCKLMPVCFILTSLEILFT